MAAMGFGQDPQTPGLAESVRRESEVFAESAAMLADAIGADLDRITFDVQFTAATDDTDLGFSRSRRGPLPACTGITAVGDKNVVSVGFNWIMGDHVTPPKPVAHGHVIQVFGVPNMRTVVYCLPSKEERGQSRRAGHDLHGTARHQRGDCRGRRRAGHPHPQGPAAGRRTVRG
jgi:4-hydroxy-tetrahydrodipicolinate reductase